jgi:hypothetical protein
MAALWDGSNCLWLVTFGAKGFSTASSADWELSAALIRRLNKRAEALLADIY